MYRPSFKAVVGLGMPSCILLAIRCKAWSLMGIKVSKTSRIKDIFVSLTLGNSILRCSRSCLGLDDILEYLTILELFSLVVY